MGNAEHRNEPNRHLFIYLFMYTNISVIDFGFFGLAVLSVIVVGISCVGYEASSYWIGLAFS